MYTRTERGWPGHFCASRYCQFRRNTLLKFPNVNIVVSTVGNMSVPGIEDRAAVCANRYYETAVFSALADLTADVTRPIHFNAPWFLGVDGTNLQADEMHEAVVAEIIEKFNVVEEHPYRMSGVVTFQTDTPHLCHGCPMESQVELFCNYLQKKCDAADAKRNLQLRHPSCPFSLEAK